MLDYHNTISSILYQEIRFVLPDHVRNDSYLFGVYSAVLAHFILKEGLPKLGILGCVMCITGSVIIVVHAPQEPPISSVLEIWNMATRTGHNVTSFLFILCHHVRRFPLWLTVVLSLPAFLLYVGSVTVLVFILIFFFAPQCGHTNVLVFTGICSLMGSLSVITFSSVKW